MVLPGAARRTYVTPAHPHGLKLGLAWAIGLKVPVLFAIPQKSNLEGNLVTDALGERAAKALKNGKRVAFPGSPHPITLFTQRDSRMTWSGPILVVFPSRELLDKIDGLNASEVLVVPWTDDEVQFWIDAWAPRQLGDATTTAPAPKLDPVVQEALRDLTGRINVSTGLVHSLDRSSAIELVEILRDARFRFTPSEVRAWLVSQGRWPARHANSMEVVCREVLAGKRLKADRNRWAGDAVERWRTRGTE
jgi:hypothetical protein